MLSGISFYVLYLLLQIKTLTETFYKKNSDFCTINRCQVKQKKLNKAHTKNPLRWGFWAVFFYCQPCQRPMHSNFQSIHQTSWLYLQHSNTNEVSLGPVLSSVQPTAIKKGKYRHSIYQSNSLQLINKCPAHFTKWRWSLHTIQFIDPHHNC
jgi:hypothetical protein